MLGKRGGGVNLQISCQDMYPGCTVVSCHTSVCRCGREGCMITAKGCGFEAVRLSMMGEG